jgi:pimeloyl-ACP methyl ester carboxylesterase/predicted glycosyltransferase
MRTTTITAEPFPPPEEAVSFRDPTRARYPDEEGYAERDGVRVFWERYGHGDPTFLLLPAWAIVTSRTWKGQIPYLARHHRVVVFDPRGNGRSDRPDAPEAYSPFEAAEDALAVLDASGTERAVAVGLSAGAPAVIALAAHHPDRVAGAVFIGPLYPVCEPMPGWTTVPVAEIRDAYEDWEKYNVHYWAENLPEFAALWARKCLPEPHSTAGVDYAVAYAQGTTPEVLAKTLGPLEQAGADTMADVFATAGPVFRQFAQRMRCPALVIQGDRDVVTPPQWAAALAEDTGGELVTFQGSGHVPHSRLPVKANLTLRDFVAPRGDPTVHRSSDGRPRALYVSSPIGLGHARRDVAISRELRALVPDLQVDWLTQHPVTRLLEAEGEHVHPASRHLANETGHLESESAEHDLHCFQAFRRMDEILVANFMVFHDLLEAEHYDLVIGDEAWDIDYYLHEHPELKRAPFAWMTDFVGFLPMPDGGDRESFLAADFNEDRIEHIANHPHVRDQAIFVGNPDDIVPERFGPGLPWIREWTEQNFEFSGYVTGFEPTGLDDRERLRAELGYGPGERVCIVSVGGSGVGGDLLRKVMTSYEEARRHVEALRMIVVAGPRIDPATLPQAEGLEVRAYVHDLYRHLAACDLAVVQGGLTTAMELTANRRPFLYFPLKHHFEQCFHVPHRLDRYGAGRRMDYHQTTPEDIAAAIAQDIGREVDYRPVETDGARRAAGRLAELL